MDDAERVRGDQRLGHLRAHVERFGERQRRPARRISDSERPCTSSRIR